MFDYLGASILNNVMTLAETQALLAEIASGINDAHTAVGITDRAKHNDVYLTLTSLSDPRTHATISTNAAGTYELHVNGGFYTGTVDDQSLDYADVRDYVESYVRAALAYLDGHWSMSRTRLLKRPRLVIQKGNARVPLAPIGHWSGGGTPF